MSVDRLSNMLSALKNASLAKKEHIELPHSKECEAVAKILKDKGFLTGVKTFKLSGKAYKMLGLDLAHKDADYVLVDVKRVSKPGRRIYRKHNELERVIGGYGVLIVSTPRGIMEGQEARKKHLGGEVLCKVL